MQQKLSDSKIIIILGAGALGCEFLKNIALMGVSYKATIKKFLSDNDNIEISNLN